MEFFDALEQILRIPDPQKKIAHFNRFYADFQNGRFRFAHNTPAKTFDAPSYATWCRVVHPSRVPRRSFKSRAGRVAMLHAIAHIEYSAIDLALDAAYRFRGMPMEFYADWLEVADDECRHFLMIEQLLKALGHRYGDLPVHAGLFEAGRRTPTLLERMAVVPRYLEANGLDANPKIIQKLSTMDDAMAKKIIEALEVILDEEIDHVKKGDRWFRWACMREGVEDVTERYLQIVEKYYPSSFHKKCDLNLKARRAAGFACDELEAICGKKLPCR